MSKIRISNDVSLPMPVVLVGAMVQGKANFMAVGWITRANYSPPMIAVGINKAQYTQEGIREHNTFSICFPGTDLVAKTDYCGIVSGRNEDKSGLFKVFYGEAQTAPMIEECPLCLECRVVHAFELPTNTLFVGEIVGAYCEERYLTNGNPDYLKTKAFLLTMPDSVYWSIGEAVGKAWSDGKNLKA